MTYRRSALGVAIWSLAVLAALATGGLAAFGVAFLLGFAVPGAAAVDLFGSDLLGRLFTAAFAVALALIAAFVLLYAALTASVIALEFRHGILTVNDRGFSTPCFFNAPIDWEEVVLSRVIGDSVVPGLPLGFPFVVLKNRRAIQARLAPLPRAASHVFAWYARWYAQQKDAEIAALVENDPDTDLLLISIMTDPPGLTEHQVAALIADRAKAA